MKFLFITAVVAVLAVAGVIGWLAVRARLRAHDAAIAALAEHVGGQDRMREIFEGEKERPRWVPRDQHALIPLACLFVVATAGAVVAWLEPAPRETGLFVEPQPSEPPPARLTPAPTPKSAPGAEDVSARQPAAATRVPPERRPEGGGGPATSLPPQEASPPPPLVVELPDVELPDVTVPELAGATTAVAGASGTVCPVDVDLLDLGLSLCPTTG